MASNPISRVDEPALPLFDEAALDIADYLRAEADAEDDIHHDEAKGHGLAALTPGVTHCWLPRLSTHGRYSSSGLLSSLSSASTSAAS